MGFRVPATEARRGDPLSTEEIFQISRKIERSCARAGLNRADADDLVQDVWVWLLADEKTLLAREPRWIGLVTAHFIQRYWRRTYQRRDRETPPHDATAQRAAPLEEAIEAKEFLDRMSAAYPRQNGGF